MFEHASSAEFAEAQDDIDDKVSALLKRSADALSGARLIRSPEWVWVGSRGRGLTRSPN
jgi:hypothetical protein